MPYNSGISLGRNRALELTQTPYFLLLDDDFVFSYRQKIGDLLVFMESNQNVDIFGGRCIDLPFYITHHFQDAALHGTTATPLLPIGSNVGGHTVVNKVQNYFIGRTDTVAKLGWNPALKVNEHTEFFTRACVQLVTVFNEDMKILHAKTPFDIDYLRFRFAAK